MAGPRVLLAWVLSRTVTDVNACCNEISGKSMVTLVAAAFRVPRLI